ncbi:MAG: sortase, partial [Anaerolineales bacterium]|nr:sortase [Anaerolineales bacterium]
YGDEIGLVGPVSHDGTQWQDDPYNRQPYPWLDESGTPFYAHLQNNIVRNTIFSHYQTLIAARHAHPALRTGSFDPLWEQSGSAVYAYGRKMADDSDAAVVVVNKGATPGNVTLQVGGYLPVGLTLTDVLSGASFTVAGDGSLAITNIPARGGYLLIPTTSFAGTRPAAPVISATAGSGQISLSWSAVSGATSYRIYRSRLSGGGYEQVGTTSGLSFNDTTVQTGLRYYYVVRAVAANGLVSEASNEVNAIPAYTINWANLQHPPSITAPRSLVTPTTHIYGRVYIAGVTDAPGPTSGLIAQVGYGNDGTLPTHASWKWFNATFNVQVGNNDEFMGQIIPDAPPGNYDYLYRYSTDGGNTWVYGAYNNIFYSNLSSYDPVNAGSLTITTPSDTTAPTAPTNLRIASASPSSIALAWDAHPNTDGDLYGFEIWRKNLTAGEPSFTRLTLLAGPALTAYTDNSVTSGHQYEYYITAVDNSANISGESNHVIQTAQTRMVAVTFRVTVPNPSPGTVYIAGNFPAPYPFWNPGGLALTETAPGTWEITLNLPEGFAVEYKYTRGNWDTVEKSATYDEISNRNVTILYGTSGTQLVTDTVATWRDPIVTSIIPANNATGVPANTTIKAFWNQPMPIPVNPSTCFSVSGPGGSVSGSISYVVLEMSYLFTPSSSLADGVYTVTINGCRDAQNDLQQVPFTSTFTVDTVHPTVLSITRNDPSPTNAAIVHFTVTFSEDVTGVDAADFSLFTSGVSGASVTGVTASSGSIYTVAVDTGSGSGTLRLDLNASGTGITDLNGNPMTSGYTGGETYIIDKTAPTLLSLTRQNPPTSPTNADVLVFRATFSEEVQNVHAGDFVVTGTTASLLNVVGVGSGPTYSVFDLTIAGGDLATLNGTVGVDLAVGQNILDLAGNSLPTVEPSVDQTYTVDNTAPQLLSFTRHNPAVSPTNADTLVFRVAFSEAVQNVDVTDFAVSGSTANVTLVTSVSASVYDVTVSGGDLATLNGFVGLNLVVSQNITDLAGNPLPSGEPPTDETYELDNQVTVLSILRQTPPTSPTNAVTVTFRVTFSEDVQNVDLGDFALTLGGTTTGALGSVTAQSASVYDVLVINVGGNGLLSLGFEATNDIADMHGNPLGATPSIGTIESYLIDHSGPTVLFGANTFPANGSLLNVGPTQIVIEYNKDVLADGSANAANHVNNYLLVEDGADDTFTSLSCAAPDLVGDTRITVNSVIYTNNGGLGPYLATLNINNGVPLPEGTYRLFVCGTTSVYDLLGNRLNNGADSILTFQVRAVGGAPSAPASLPETGFALGRITQLAPQPTEKTYAQTDLWLEIPKLGLKMKIVGVPLVNGEWDVSWLGKNAGWLEGSAFPSWAGNSVLTGHVWNADNTPGPFRSLHTLWWGDQIIVRVGNTEYIYEVRSVQQVKPWEVSRMMKHEERPWLTLVTCRGYDEKTGTYKYRILVRAVLVKVK